MDSLFGGAKNESIFSKLSGGFMALICIPLPPSLGVCLPIYIGFGAAGHKDNGQVKVGDSEAQDCLQLVEDFCLISSGC